MLERFALGNAGHPASIKGSDFVRRFLSDKAFCVAFDLGIALRDLHELEKIRALYVKELEQAFIHFGRVLVLTNGAVR